MSTYPLHKYGISGTFSTMSRKAAIEFYAMFVPDIENRINILQDALRADVGVDIEKYDNAALALTLDTWLSDRYAILLASDGYASNLKEEQLVIFGAMCLDTVLCCAERIRHTHIGVEWVKYSGPRSHDAYQKPVMIKRGSSAVFDPFRLSSTVVAKHLTRNGQTIAIATILNGWDLVFAR